MKPPLHLYIPPMIQFFHLNAGTVYAVEVDHRLNEDERAQLAAAVARHIGEPFHLTAREQSPRYCTTIIYDALTALRPSVHARWRHIDLPLLEGDYLFPQALAELPGLEWL